MSRIHDVAFIRGAPSDGILIFHKTRANEGLKETQAAGKKQSMIAPLSSCSCQRVLLSLSSIFGGSRFRCASPNRT